MIHHIKANSHYIVLVGACLLFIVAACAIGTAAMKF